MIKKTQWRPDTCDCVLEYEWDDQSDPATRVHTPTKIVKACPHHEAAVDTADGFDKVLKENTGKNRAIGRIMDLAAVTEETTDRDGNTVKRLKAGKNISWSFNEKRELELELVGFTEKEKQDAVTEISKDTEILDRVKMKGEANVLSKMSRV